MGTSDRSVRFSSGDSNPDCVAQFEALEDRRLLAAPVIVDVDFSLGTGRFIQSVEAINTVSVAAFDPDGGASGGVIASVEFSLAGVTVADTDQSDGLSADLDMSVVGSGGRTLGIRVTDSDGEVTETTRELHGIDKPAWLFTSEPWDAGIFYDEKLGHYSARVGLVIESTKVDLPPSVVSQSPIRNPDGTVITDGTTGVDVFLQHSFYIELDGSKPRFNLGFFSTNLVALGITFFEEVALVGNNQPFSATIGDDGDDDEPVLTVSGSIGVDMTADLEVVYTLEANMTLEGTTNLLEFDLLDIPIPKPPFSAVVSLGIDIGFDLSAGFRVSFADGQLQQAQSRFSGGFTLTPYAAGSWGVYDDVVRGGIKTGGDLRLGIEKTFDSGIRFPFSTTWFLDYFFVVLGSEFSGRITENVFFSTPDLVTDLTGMPLDIPEISFDFDDSTPPSITTVTFVGGSGGFAGGHIITQRPDQPGQVRVQDYDQNGNPESSVQLTSEERTRSGLVVTPGPHSFALWTEETVPFGNPDDVSTSAVFGSRQIYYARQENGVWSAPAPLFNDPQARADFSPTVAFNANGTGVAVWVRSSDNAADVNGSATDGTDLYYAVWDGDSWSTTLTGPDASKLGVSGRADLQPKIVALDNNDFLLTWVSKDGSGNDQISYRQFFSNGAPAGEGLASTSGVIALGNVGYVRELSVTPVENGRAYIAWVRTATDDVTQAEGAAWPPAPQGSLEPETIATGTSIAFGLSLASYENTVAAVFVGAGSAGGSQVFVAFRNLADAGGNWTIPSHVTSGDRPYRDVAGAFDPSTGDLLVRFSASDQLENTGGGTPETAYQFIESDPSKPLVVRIPRAADLDVYEFESYPEFATSSSRGEFFYDFLIANRGMLPSGAFTILIEGPGGVIESIQHPGLSVGGSERFEGSVGSLVTRIRVQPGSGDAIEANNESYVRLIRSEGGFIELFVAQSIRADVPDDPGTPSIDESYFFHVSRNGNELVRELLTDPDIAFDYAMTDWGAENYWFQDENGNIYSLWHGGDVHLAENLNGNLSLADIPSGEHQWHLTNLTLAAGVTGAVTLEKGSVSGVLTGWRAFSIQGISNGQLVTLWFAPANGAGQYLDSDGLFKPGAATGSRANGWLLNSISDQWVDLSGELSAPPALLPFTDTTGNGRTEFDPRRDAFIANTGISILLFSSSGDAYVASFSVSQLDIPGALPQYNGLNWVVERVENVASIAHLGIGFDELMSLIGPYRLEAIGSL